MAVISVMGARAEIGPRIREFVILFFPVQIPQKVISNIERGCRV